MFLRITLCSTSEHRQSRQGRGAIKDPTHRNRLGQTVPHWNVKYYFEERAPSNPPGHCCTSPEILS